MCSHFHDMDYLVYLKNGKIPLDQIAQMAVNKKKRKKRNRKEATHAFKHFPHECVCD